MKALPVSLILFSLLIVCLTANAMFIKSFTKSLSCAADELASPNGREEKLTELETYWEKNREIVGLSVSHIQLDKFGDIIINLRQAHRYSDEAEFQRNLTLLRELARNLERTERISFENLL